MTKIKIMDKELLEDYKQRNIRWTEKSVSQLSYYNNLMLTLSVGFIAFSFNSLLTRTNSLSLEKFDLSAVLMLLSLITMSGATYKGLIISLNRLMDFKITRLITSIRKRMLKHSSAKMNENTPPEMVWCERRKLIGKLFKEDYPKISIEECKRYKKMNNPEKDRINKNFEELRKISDRKSVV